MEENEMGGTRSLQGEMRTAYKSYLVNLGQSTFGE
jgi:hypothetical protein